jgi:hypothetical protein
VDREVYLLEDLAAPSDAGKVEGGKLNQTTDPSVSTPVRRRGQSGTPLPGVVSGLIAASGQWGKAGEEQALNLKLMSLWRVDFLEQIKKSFYKPSFPHTINPCGTTRKGLRCHNTETALGLELEPGQDDLTGQFQVLQTSQGGKQNLRLLQPLDG